MRSSDVLFFISTDKPAPGYCQHHPCLCARAEEMAAQGMTTAAVEMHQGVPDVWVRCRLRTGSRFSHTPQTAAPSLVARSSRRPGGSFHSRDFSGTEGAGLPQRGGHRWRVTLFHREPRATLIASQLVRLATADTFAYWRSHYGAIPTVPLTTEVDPGLVRHKRDPGRCFLRAGWAVVGASCSHRHRGAIVLAAPSGNP
jgi:hypothetical protein